PRMLTTPSHSKRVRPSLSAAGPGMPAWSARRPTPQQHAGATVTPTRVVPWRRCGDCVEKILKRCRRLTCVVITSGFCAGWSGAGSRGPQGRLDGVPGQARRQHERDDVGDVVPGLELLPDLSGGAAGGELVEDDPGLGGYGPAPRAGARVRGDDRADLGGVALAGQGAGVDVAHSAQVPGGAGR